MVKSPDGISLSVKWFSGLCALLLMILVGLIVYNIGSLMGVFPNQELYHRTATYYAQSSLREMTSLLEETQEKDRSYPLGKAYWGPFDEKLIVAVGGDPAKLIDPYHRQGSPEKWRIGPRTDVDRGAPIHVRGLDYWYYNNGKNFYAFVSRGPDGDLDVTTTSLQQAGERKDIQARRKILSDVTYDVTNGTVSNGDIIRLKD